MQFLHNFQQFNKYILPKCFYNISIMIKYHYFLPSAVKKSRALKCSFCQPIKSMSFLSPDNVLSSSNKNKCIHLLKSMNPVNSRGKISFKKAAVLVPLCQIDGELGFLYTVRAQWLKVNGGQVSFPGGMQDKTDGSLRDTAFRETFEEIGLCKENIDLWGCGPDVHRSDLTVTPFLGYIGNVNINNLKVNSTEVSLVFMATLAQLSSSDNFRTTQFRLGKTHVYTTPVYFTTQKRVWGLTAIITHSILSALIPEVYSSNIKFKPTYNKIFGIKPLNLNSDRLKT